MNRVLASFTSSEKNLITFVLALMAFGYGILEWRDWQQGPLVFNIAEQRNKPKTWEEQNAMPAGMDAAGMVDVNVADGKLLETLPKIGPSLSATIVRYRKVNGPFKSMEDLDKVPGIGQAMMARLAPLVTFGGQPDVLVAVPLSSPQPPDSSESNFPGTRRPAGFLVNINTGGADELDKLKGVGPALAKRIIQDRQLRGPFMKPEDLDRVRGIGPKILQNNHEHICVK